MINIFEVVSELNRYKWAYDDAIEQLKEKDIQLKSWISLFNAARYIAINLAARSEVGINVDEMIISRKNQEEINEKSKKS